MCVIPIFVLCLTLESRNRCLRTNYWIANLHKELRVLGDKDIDTRAKLDEAKAVVLLNMLAWLGVRHDTACDKTCNLTHKHLAAILKADDSRRALILGRRLRMPCYKEATMVVLGILYLATNREPVDMYVGDRHEDRYLQHLAIYVLMFVYYLGDNNAAITRREYKLVIVNLHTTWLAEKGCNEEPEYDQEDSQEPHEVGEAIY